MLKLHLSLKFEKLFILLIQLNVFFHINCYTIRNFVYVFLSNCATYIKYPFLVNREFLIIIMETLIQEP
jgi:hypothetical protein